MATSTIKYNREVYTNDTTTIGLRSTNATINKFQSVKFGRIRVVEIMFSPTTDIAKGEAIISGFDVFNVTTGMISFLLFNNSVATSAPIRGYLGEDGSLRSSENLNASRSIRCSFAYITA